MEVLSNEGYYQCDFHTTLFHSILEKIEYFDSNITIRRLDRNEFNLFSEIYTEGFDMPVTIQNGIARNNEILYDTPNWSFFLASINHTPAGIGVLFIKNEIATLAAATTILAFRNKGIHTALIQKRLLTALDSNVKIAIGQAKFASVSQNNMERVGFRMAYTKAIWRKRLMI